MEIKEESLIVNLIETYDYGPDPVQGVLTWSQVGVKVFVRVTEEEKEVRKEDIFGKGHQIGNVILSLPRKVLNEK